jgi:HNH endonuclease
MTCIDEAREKLLLAAFRLPQAQTVSGRKTTITNAFVCSVIPSIQPSAADIEQALAILAIDPCDMRCAYCGDRSTSFDHLRPLVLNRRPTGYITEIANLVPSCGRCNSSKGNQSWRTWMVSVTATHSPTKRGIADTARRMALLERYEQWRAPIRIDFAAMIGKEEWERYWSRCEAVIEEMRRCEDDADVINARVAQFMGQSSRPASPD